MSKPHDKVGIRQEIFRTFETRLVRSNQKDVSAKCFAEDSDKLIRFAADAPVVEEAAAGRVGDPKVSFVKLCRCRTRGAHGRLPRP